MILAPYAQKAGDSAGGISRNPKHPHRTDYQRDRARIIHSRAFRRLEYKTQVFLNGTGDHLRTRLTHTFEVANITRTVARALSLNEDLAEAIALAHDLGHPPFGHTGEETLDELMRGHGGFDHNSQSLRIVDPIEIRYPNFPGLNLSHEVREGARRSTRSSTSIPKAGGGEHPQPSLEAQIANLADEITYYSHDLDDGLDFPPDRAPAARGTRRVAGDPRRKSGRHFPALKEADLRAYVIRCPIPTASGGCHPTSSALVKGRSADRRGSANVELDRSSATAGPSQGEPAAPAIPLQEPLLSSERRGANQRACEMLGEVFQGLPEESEIARRSDDAANPEGRSPPDGLRLRLRHDRSLSAR